jgi:hypothetical protein
MANLLSISRKKRYLIQSLLFLVFGYFLFIVLDLSIVFEILFNVVFVLIFVSISHYPNIKLNNIVYGSILPLQLILSSTLFFYFYPNLGYLFKILMLVIFSFLYYVASLVDNIFLVIQDREEQIPMYRVASTWSQILSVVISIPLYSSIFKLDTLFIWQSFFVFISALLFSFYQFWILRFDKDIKKVKTGEFLLLNLLAGFLVLATSLSISFFPTESFLRALMVSSVLMFSLNYVQSHLKNDINEKFLYQSLLISVIFFIILFLFNP